MIGTPPGVRMLVEAKPVDFRKGMDGLAALAQQKLAQDPFCGTVLVFRAKRADRVKLLFWDGSGLCLFAKRLTLGTFPVLWRDDGLAVRLTQRELALFLEGSTFFARRPTASPIAHEGLVSERGA